MIIIISYADILSCVVSWSSLYEMRTKRPYSNYPIYNAWIILTSIRGHLSISFWYYVIKGGPRDYTDGEYMSLSIQQHISSADILSYVVSWSSLYEMSSKRRYINFLTCNAWTIISAITEQNEDQETTQMENIHQYISAADILCYVVSLSSFYEMRFKWTYVNYLSK